MENSSNMNAQQTNANNRREDYIFRTHNNLCTQCEEEKQIHTIGTVVYSADKICLKNLNGDELIPLNILSDNVPENGMHIHLYGVSKNYISTGCLKRQKKTSIDIYFWNAIEIAQRAKELEKLLDKINCNLT